MSTHFKRMRSKLPLDFIDSDADYLINRQGAKVYHDITKNPLLDLNEGETRLYVLSVGFTKNMVATATIGHLSGVACYRLPADLTEWAITCVTLANAGSKLFPTHVKFNTIENRHYADIL